LVAPKKDDTGCGGTLPRSQANLNPVPINEIVERWIGKLGRGRLRLLAELKEKLEGEADG